MELKQMKELMAAMGRTGTTKLTIEKEGFKLHLERGAEGGSRIISDPQLEYEESLFRGDMARHRAHISPVRQTEEPIRSARDEGKEEEGSYVTSPMVGTFYASPGVGEPSFVKVGDNVDKDTVICIVEAMKVMNEIKAGVDGVVAEILIDNGHPVEFGTKLFRII